MPRYSPRLPERVATPADIVEFFSYLGLVDRVSFHPDDGFYDEKAGEVAYSSREGAPAYTVREARARDRLMAQAFEVAGLRGLDIYGVALWTNEAIGLNTPSDDPPPRWVRGAVSRFTVPDPREWRPGRRRGGGR